MQREDFFLFERLLFRVPTHYTSLLQGTVWSSKSV